VPVTNKINKLSADSLLPQCHLGTNRPVAARTVRQKAVDMDEYCHTQWRVKWFLVYSVVCMSMLSSVVSVIFVALVICSLLLHLIIWL